MTWRSAARASASTRPRSVADRRYRHHALVHAERGDRRACRKINASPGGEALFGDATLRAAGAGTARGSGSGSGTGSGAAARAPAAATGRASARAPEWQRFGRRRTGWWPSPVPERDRRHRGSGRCDAAAALDDVHRHERRAGDHQRARDEVVPEDNGNGRFCFNVSNGTNLGVSILGDRFLRAYVTTIDVPNGRIGFAPDRGCSVSARAQQVREPSSEHGHPPQLSSRDRSSLLLALLVGAAEPEQQSVFAAHVAPVLRQQKPLEQVEPAATSQSRLSVHEAPSAIGPQPEAVQVPEQQSPAVVHEAVLPRQQRADRRAAAELAIAALRCKRAAVVRKRAHVPPLQ